MSMSETVVEPKIEPEIDSEEQPDLARRKLLFNFSESPAETEEISEEDETPLFTVITDYIRTISGKGEIVGYLSFLAPPFSVPEESLEDAFEQMAEQPNYSDIAVIKGEKDNYYYSTRTMATNYANTLVLLLEKDSCKVIAEAIRFECQVYPRPYKKQMLAYAPYYFSENQIEAALALMQQNDEYQDIQQVAASNDEPYLFSSQFMSYGKAKGLCEWFEVEQHQNP